MRPLYISELTNQQCAQAESMYAAGATCKQIARHLHVSNLRVSEHLRKHDLLRKTGGRRTHSGRKAGVQAAKVVEVADPWRGPETQTITVNGNPVPDFDTLLTQVSRLSQERGGVICTVARFGDIGTIATVEVNSAMTCADIRNGLRLEPLKPMTREDWEEVRYCPLKETACV